MKYKCVSAKVTALNTQLTMLIPRQYSLEGGMGIGIGRGFWLGNRGSEIGAGYVVVRVNYN